MKLLRFGEAGAERPGLLAEDGTIRDLAGIVDDIAGDALSDEGLAVIAGVDPAELPIVPEGTRLGPPVAGTGKFVCIGRNYAEHAAETGAEVPGEPLIFMKATSAISGPDDAILLPRGSVSTDWEVELAVVIGRRANYVTEAEALSHVAGYMVANDVSERDYQKRRAGQWTKGKSCDTFGPIGPWLVTRDEVPDPQALTLHLTVDGETMQHGSTADMVFGVARLVSYLSEFMTLHPGDIISTGTPDGVGAGRTPPRFLRAANVVELEIGGLGRQRQTVVADEG